MNSDFARRRLHQVAEEKSDQGYDIAAQLDLLDTAPDHALPDIARQLADAPLRPDWPYVEPSALEDIRTHSATSRATQPLCIVDPHDAADRVRAGFLGSVAGCVLGKPVEFNPTLAELRASLERIDEWPISDYISERVLTVGGLRQFHVDWPETVRERIRWAAPDDDINYTLLGMLTLERYGPDLTRAQLASVWIDNLPIGWAFGPERTALLRLGEATLGNRDIDDELTGEVAQLDNPGEERCGAMIRADVWGYAFPGDPERASALAWRDATLTHRRTGVYAAMFTAALVSSAFVVEDPIELAETALQYVPQRSRFHVAISDCLLEISRSKGWLEAYEVIHRKYDDFGHCRVYQETGTLLNTLRFATSVGEGICIQVSQGNDTDSFGALAGAVLGAKFGTKGLEQRWITPFRDQIHTTVATLHEPSLTALAERISALPQILSDWSPAPDMLPPNTSLGWMG